MFFGRVDFVVVSVSCATASLEWRVATFDSHVAGTNRAFVFFNSCSATGAFRAGPADMAYRRRAALGVQTAKGHGRVGCTFAWWGAGLPWELAVG